MTDGGQAMTDEQRLQRAVIVLSMGITEERVADLEHIVGKTQNDCSTDGPPVNPVYWTAARTAATSARAALDHIATVAGMTPPRKRRRRRKHTGRAPIAGRASDREQRNEEYKRERGSNG